MDPFNFAAWGAMGERKAAAGLPFEAQGKPQSKKGRSKLRHYKESLLIRYLNHGDIQLSWRRSDSCEGGRVC